MELISKNLVYEVLEAAISTGAVFAEVFVEHNKLNNLSIVNNKVDKALSGIDFGLGLRVFDGFGAVYTYTNNLSRESLLKTAKDAALVIKNRTGSKQMVQFASKDYKEINHVKTWPGDMPKKDIIDRLKILCTAASDYDNLITQTMSTYRDSIQTVLIANTEGVWAEDVRSLVSFNMTAVASDGNEKQTGYFNKGSRIGMEFLDSLDMKALGQQAAEKAITMLRADLCPSGAFPVVIDNGFGGVIFHEACGHSLEATSVAKNASVFCGKIGEKIACEKVTAIDDGTMENHWGSLKFDDEGTPTQRNVLIENGVLKSYMVDKLNGLKMNTASTGSSRRESYRFAPTSRMTNTYIDKGTDKQSDIIASVDYGIYAKTMGGGSVQPATGDFNFAVTESYLIENGKITTPVRGASLIGKGSEVLMNIDMVSDNLLLAQGMCGSMSGSVPTNVGQPMVRVKKITVGGRK